MKPYDLPFCIDFLKKALRVHFSTGGVRVETLEKTLSCKIFRIQEADSV